MNQSASDELQAIKLKILEMSQAEKDYGCGYYETTTWRDAYDELVRMAGGEPNE
jgi:hypothetical protein